MAKEKKLEWLTEKRKVNDLLPLDINPRKISEHKKQTLIKSIEKFNLAEIPAINKDNTIIAGHQRISALQLIGRGDEMIDVRVPNRQLTKKELKEYNLISNTHAGEWDFEIMEVEFADIEIEEWDIEMPTIFESIENEKSETTVGKNLKEKSTNHVLVTYPKALHEKINEVLADLKDIEGVQLEYSKK